MTRTKKDKLRRQQNPYKKAEPAFRCLFCRVQCSSKLDFASHLKGKIHLENEAKRPLYGGLQEGDYYCEPCNRFDIKSDHDYQAHIKGQPHLEKCHLWRYDWRFYFTMKTNKELEAIGQQSLYCKPHPWPNKTKHAAFNSRLLEILSEDMRAKIFHQYGINLFKLIRLPSMQCGKILGIIGANGIGKTTALKLLAGKIEPNLGNFVDQVLNEQLLKYFYGSLSMYYIRKLLSSELKIVMKIQQIENLKAVYRGKVSDIFQRYGEGNYELILNQLGVEDLLISDCNDLSLGELQLIAIGLACIQTGDVFLFDEPFKYLDFQQCVKAANTIRSISTKSNYVVVADHDLSVVDYVSDLICVLYGVPGKFGIVTMPFSVREGINIFLDGFVPTENLRFREESLIFKVSDAATKEETKRLNQYEYPDMVKTLGTFKLDIKAGQFTGSEIIVMLGENGTGKTTFIRMLAGNLQPDEGSSNVPVLNVSYKPQKISPKSLSTVRQLLHDKIGDAYLHPQFMTDVVKPLKIEELMDNEVQNLSGGEIQRVALTICLGRPADVYLIDEPSAYLDSEQRIVAAKVIKRFILHAKKTGFIVEHDFIMATYLADRVIVFDGKPSHETVANTPQNLLVGMNKFLELLGLTFRRDPNNYRPSINKVNSVKDIDQKREGNYFFLED